MGADHAAIELSHVTKTYHVKSLVGLVTTDITGVDDLSLTIESGRISGLIGPSGCGKTTLVRLVVGVLRPDKGTVRILGHDPLHLTSAQREQIGYTPQSFFLYPTLTVRENANFIAGLTGLPLLGKSRRLGMSRKARIEEVLKFLELWEARNRLARDLSGGMQRRLMLACALIYEPKVLIVDEPTAGLDPVLRAKIWEHLAEQRDKGTTVLVTTQYIDEAAYCDTIAVMATGRVLEVGAPDELRARALGGEVLRITAEDLGREELARLRQMDGIQSARWEDQDTLRLVVDDAATLTPVVVQELQDRNVNVMAVEPYEPSFDEVFMEIVKRHA